MNINDIQNVEFSPLDGQTRSTAPDDPQSIRRLPENSEATANWRDRRVVLVHGQYDQRSTPYETITLGDCEIMAALCGPTVGPKSAADAIIPSMYHERDARTAAAQQEHGQYCALVFDNDKGNHSAEEIKAAISVIVGPDVAFWVYSTASARPDDRRWRVVIPSADVLSYSDWLDANEVVVARLGVAGILADRSMLRASQISFLPNVPPELCDEDGRPLLYESFDQDGIGLSWAAIADDVEALRRDRQLDDIFATVEKNIRPFPPASAGSSVIQAFNAAHEITDLLAGYGYEQSPRSTDDWRSPMQTSDTYATRVGLSRDGQQVFISLSASDAEAGLGAKAASGCRYGDAFDLWKHFEHGGDQSAALKAASALLNFQPVVAGPIPADNAQFMLPPMPPPFPGEMTQIVEAALAVSPKPQPSSALLAALIGMASACDGHYSLPSGARMNLYGLIVGNTGTGKDMPQTVIKTLGVAAGIRVYGEVGSGQGLEDHIVSYGGAIMVVDEISHTLAATCAKNAPAYLKSAEGMYLKLFSASRTMYTTRLLAKSTSTSSGRTVQHPCLSLMGFATPQGLGEALGEGAITSGLLGRMLMARADDGVRVRPVRGSFVLPEDVRTKIQCVAEGWSNPFEPDKIREIEIPADVNQHLENLMQQLDDEMEGAPNEGERALRVRSYEKVERIAGVLAIWDNPTKPTMTREMANWAEAMVRASDGAVSSFVRRHMHAGVVQANAARVLETIKKVLTGAYKTDRTKEVDAISAGHAPRSTTLRACKALDKQSFGAAVEHLVAQGDIIQTQYHGLATLVFPADEGV